MGEGNNPYSVGYVADANYSALTVDYHENQFLYQLNQENTIRLAYPNVRFPGVPTNPLAFDRYAYTFNNPVRYNDPSGHCPFCIAAGATLLGISPVGWVVIGVVVIGAVALSIPEVRQATAHGMANVMDSLSNAVYRTSWDKPPYGLTKAQEKLWGKAVERLKEGVTLPPGYQVSDSVRDKVADMIRDGETSVEAIADALAGEIENDIAKQRPPRSGPRHRNNRGEDDE